MKKMHDLNDLVGITDIAEMFGVVISTVSNWTVRYDDFPKPVAVISHSIPIYSRSQVYAWHTIKWGNKNWKPPFPIQVNRNS